MPPTNVSVWRHTNLYIFYGLSESFLRHFRISSTSCSTDTLGDEGIIGTIASNHRNRLFDSSEQAISATLSLESNKLILGY